MTCSIIRRRGQGARAGPRHHALRAAAAANGGDDDKEVERAYAALRRLLIDCPVLTDLDLRQWEREFPRTDASGQTDLRRLIDEAYIPRTVSGVHEYLRCPGCRNTVPDMRSPSGTAGCLAPSAEAVTVRALAVICEQHRATRRFIHDPGLVEARILDALAGDDELAGRVRVTAYPWGADAKDQESARLLGRTFGRPDSMTCDRRFLVLPAHRAARPGYVDDLVAELDGRVEGVEVVDEKRLISMVRATARRLGR